VPGAVDNVHEAADPGPVARRPEHALVRVVREESVHHLEARVVAGQDPVAVEGALRFARRPARVEQQRWVIPGGLDGRERRRVLARPLEERPVVFVAGLEEDDLLQRVGRVGCQRLDVPLGRYQRRRAAVDQPVFERLRAEQHRERHEHPTELEYRHVHHERLGTFR